jgi:hypothetical protein
VLRVASLSIEAFRNNNLFKKRISPDPWVALVDGAVASEPLGLRKLN